MNEFIKKKLDTSNLSSIINASKCKLSENREKGDIADLENSKQEVVGAELVIPLTGKPYGVMVFNGIDNLYFTCTKITRLVRALFKMNETSPLTIDSDGVIRDTFMISIGEASTFEAEDGRIVTYYPIEPIEYED